MTQPTIWWIKGDDPRVNTQYILSVAIDPSVNDGDVVRFNGTVFVQAQADTSTNADAIGFIVNKNSDTNTGDLIIANGILSGFSGLTAGTSYYLSSTTAGGLTSTKPSLPVFLGIALNSSTIITSIKNEIGSVLRQVPQVGCSNGNIVRFDGSSYVPAIADSLTNAKAVGIIQNVSGGTGDVYISGLAPSTGLTASSLPFSNTIIPIGSNAPCYLSQTVAGAVTSEKPDHGLVVLVGNTDETDGIRINITPMFFQSYSNEVFCPINYAQKSSGLAFFQLISGTGTVTYNASAPSKMGTGAFEFTGTGVWVLNTVYAVNPDVGIGGFANYASTASATISLGYRGFDSTQTEISHNAVQNNFLANGVVYNSTTYAYVQNISTKEGSTAGTLPTNTRWLQPRIEISANAGTVMLDSFIIYPNKFATLTLYG
jgi:hypothetical protein